MAIAGDIRLDNRRTGNITQPTMNDLNSISSKLANAIQTILPIEGALSKKARMSKSGVILLEYLTKESRGVG